MELNNTIATPLYKQLEEKLQKEIETGERPAGKPASHGERIKRNI